MTAADKFAAVLQSNVKLTVAQLYSNPTNLAAMSEISNSANRYGTIRSNKRKQVDGNTLAIRWGISSDKAIETVKNITQQGVWSFLYPTLSSRYPTNYRMLCYKGMSYPFFSDTLQAGTKYARGNIYGQAYCTSFAGQDAIP